MSALTPLKTAIVSSVFALSAWSAQAQNTRPQYEFIREKPTCGIDFVMLDTLKDYSYFPTGVKGSNDKFDMEIYENPNTGRWKLIGISKDDKIARKGDVCQLTWGARENAYTNTSWFKENFVPLKNNMQLADRKNPPKPNMN